MLRKKKQKKNKKEKLVEIYVAFPNCHINSVRGKGYICLSRLLVRGNFMRNGIKKYLILFYDIESTTKTSKIYEQSERFTYVKGIIKKTISS